MSTARTLDRITLSDIREVLGQNGKRSSGNWLFQCPICRDSSADNLIVKGNGAYIHCFSCSNNEGGKYVLTEIERKRAEERKKEQNVVVNEQPRFTDELLQSQYVEYMYITNEYLLEHDDLLSYFKNNEDIILEYVLLNRTVHASMPIAKDYDTDFFHEKLINIIIDKSHKGIQIIV